MENVFFPSAGSVDTPLDAWIRGSGLGHGRGKGGRKGAIGTRGQGSKKCGQNNECTVCPLAPTGGEGTRHPKERRQRWQRTIWTSRKEWK